jgi:hypothetical protein
VTGAYSTIGVNPVDGVIFLRQYYQLVTLSQTATDMSTHTVNQKSPVAGAWELWGRQPLTSELPALRSSSDIIWSFWNRGAAGNLHNINKIMSLDMMNDDTLTIANRAINNWVPPEGQPKVTQVQPWPGTTFLVHADDDNALALLGS